MVVKKKHSEIRQKTGRLSIRIHEDLRSALDYLADAEHRPLSNYIETLLIQSARERLTNPISNDGKRLDDRIWQRHVDWQRDHSSLAGLPPVRTK
jgi:uncharacterized protein (DUF1778 family)